MTQPDNIDNLVNKAKCAKEVFYEILPTMIQVRSPVPREDRNLTESAMAPIAVRR